MAAPIGNTYAAKSRILEQTLKRCVMQDDGKRLRAACESALTQAAKGSLPHLEFVASRLDGAVRKADERDDGDAKAISLNDLMHAILQARKAEAIDAPQSALTAIETHSQSDPADAPTARGDIPVQATGLDE